MEEMRTPKKNKIWDLCTLPKGHKIVGCKWVFIVKYRTDGAFDKHKARFTTFVKSQGYNQRHFNHTLFTKVSKIQRGHLCIPEKYNLDLLAEIGMMGCCPADTPIKFNAKLRNSGSIVDIKSTLGNYIFVWGNLVTWRSKKQGVVVRSSVEGEYKVMSLGICEEIWL
ncbi:reverse transcriptase [Cucumis melo var. makuwa]|uniref:Reverse transcriptase n=1 Tax=Cucumis melo var. makuwa TaxID=1194695 RepID=A0A5A7UFL9_CUCMM|nr:reverse transcriptase [Cucumis melo var. makuwa]